MLSNCAKAMLLKTTINRTTFFIENFPLGNVFKVTYLTLIMVTKLKYPVLLVLISALLITGCISTPPFQQTNPPTQTTTQPNCTTTIQQIPVITQQCNNVSVTTPVCGMRKLPYTVTDVPKVDLCISDGACDGQPLSKCTANCTKAMTRCELLITNNDKNESGTWSVIANFTFGNNGFIKNPINQTIAPNASGLFDFNQLYDLNYPVSSADCSLSIILNATVNDCQQITTMQNQCNNATTYQNVSKQTCT